MNWYIYYALKQLFPSKKIVSFFSFVSIIGVSLGVCILIIVQSVMNGFGDNIKNRLTELEGDIKIETNQLSDWEQIMESLIKEDFIESLSPYIESIVMLHNNGFSEYPLLRGIDLKYQNLTLPVDDYIVEGELSSLGKNSIIIGYKLAKKLNLVVGSKVDLYSPELINYFNEQEIVFPKTLEVVGFFKSGSPSLDSQIVICNLFFAQELLGYDNVITGFNIKSNGDYDLETVKENLYINYFNKNDGTLVSSWVDLNYDFLYAVEQEKNIISFIILFILLVASFSITVALTLSVVRKTKEIGLLRTFGANSYGIALSFCFQGLLIGLLGTIMGFILAFIFLENRELIFSVYSNTMKTNVNFLGVYDLYQIPVKYLFEDFLMTFIFSIAISTCASLIPAIKASLLKPSNALKNE